MDTTKPSRALDAAVAKIMGVEHGVFYRRKRTIDTLPHYSSPDRYAVLSMILWLMERNIVLLERTKEGKTLVDLTDGSGDTDSNAVEGEPLQALALALCQVVVRVGGLEE